MVNFSFKRVLFFYIFCQKIRDEEVNLNSLKRLFKKSSSYNDRDVARMEIAYSPKFLSTIGSHNSSEDADLMI